MRTRDEHKQEAIIRATVKLVNEIGFVYSSVAKIAQEANVSPATIYIYYKNKEDLLVQTYIDIKQKMSEAFLKDFDERRPFRDIFECMWLNGFEFVAQNREYFQFAEQFSNSPYSDLVDHAKLDKHIEPILKVIQKGIEQKVIKNVPFNVLSLFVYYPLLGLSNPKICGNFVMNRDNIKQAFTLAWDAIKL